MGVIKIPNIIAGQLALPSDKQPEEVTAQAASQTKNDVVTSINGEESAELSSTSPSDLRAALRFAASSQSLLDDIGYAERLEVVRLVLNEYAGCRNEVARRLALYRGLPAKDAYWMSDLLVRWSSHLDELAAFIYGSPAAARGPLSSGRDLLTWKSKGVCAFFLSSTMDGPSAVTALCHCILTGTHMIVRPSWRDVVTHFAFETLLSHGLGHFGQLVRWSSSSESSAGLNRQLLGGVSQSVVFSSNETYQELLTTAANNSPVLRDELSQRTKRYGTGLPLAVVMPGADLARAAADLVEGARLGGGRFCLSSGPILVHQEVKAELSRLLVERARSLRVGPATDASTDLPSHMADERSALSAGLAALGGRRLYGDIRQREMDLLLLDELPEQSPCLHQEFPGTLLALVTVSSLQEAAAKAKEALRRNGRLAWTAVTFFGPTDQFSELRRSISSFRYLRGGVAAQVKLLLPHQGSYFGSDLIRRVSIEEAE